MQTWHNKVKRVGIQTKKMIRIDYKIECVDKKEKVSDSSPGTFETSAEAAAAAAGLAMVLRASATAAGAPLEWRERMPEMTPLSRANDAGGSWPIFCSLPLITEPRRSTCNDNRTRASSVLASSAIVSMTGSKTLEEHGFSRLVSGPVFIHRCHEL